MLERANADDARATFKDGVLEVEECVSSPIVTVTPETDVQECVRTMEEHRVRRVPVVDETGTCCGMVSQADIAKRAPARETADLVKEISQPTPTAARAG